MRSSFLFPVLLEIDSPVLGCVPSRCRRRGSHVVARLEAAVVVVDGRPPSSCGSVAQMVSTAAVIGVLPTGRRLSIRLGSAEAPPLLPKRQGLR